MCIESLKYRHLLMDRMCRLEDLIQRYYQAPHEAELRQDFLCVKAAAIVAVRDLDDREMQLKGLRKAAQKREQEVQQTLKESRGTIRRLKADNKRLAAELANQAVSAAARVKDDEEALYPAA